MDFPTRSSICSCHREQFHHAYSFKRCCFFVFIFLSFIVVALGMVIFFIWVILKPREPKFSIQAIKLETYELSAYSSSTPIVSAVVSLTLSAENPNKVGIRYSPSRLHVLHEGLPIGEIRIPSFYQPAHSNNTSVSTRILFDCVNVSQIIYGVSSEDDAMKSNNVRMKILGDITVHVHLLHVILPKFKVALDCDVIIDYRQLTIRVNEPYIVKAFGDHIASFSSNPETFSKKCSLAVYM